MFLRLVRSKLKEGALWRFREYYEERGLDEVGRPLQAILEQAGLAEVGVALHGEP